MFFWLLYVPYPTHYCEFQIDAVTNYYDGQYAAALGAQESRNCKLVYTASFMHSDNLQIQLCSRLNLHKLTVDFGYRTTGLSTTPIVEAPTLVV